MNAAIKQSLRALLRHYRRHPVQGLFLVTGITVANVLLVGTLLINAQARASYDEGAQVLRAGPVATIRPADGSRSLDEREYIRLRRAGHSALLPVLNRNLRTADGGLVELMGIDPLALSGVTVNQGDSVPAGLAAGGAGSFIAPPYELWASPARIRQGNWSEGERLRLPDGTLLPRLRAVEGAGLGHRMLLDIGALQVLTGSAKELSSIWVFDQSERAQQRLLGDLPSGLSLIPNAEQPDPARLTRSFHLNLTAMGLLTFVVGVFLIYNAVAFSFTDRESLLGKLRLSGATHRELAVAAGAELSIFLAIGMVLGYWLGGLLAAWLLPGVGQTLAQLYGVYIAYPDRLLPSAVVLPAAMTLFAGGLCLWISLKRALAAPLMQRHSARWTPARNTQRDRRLLAAGGTLLAVSCLMAWQASSLGVALAGLAALLLGAAFSLPWLLRLALAWIAGRTPAGDARLTWLVADSRWLLGPAALALMALVLALVANHGLNTMISSFRAATDNWLGQRLVADLYYGGSVDSQAAGEWLQQVYPGIEIAERLARQEDRPAPDGRAVPIEIISLPDIKRYRDSVVPMRQRGDALAGLHAGQTMMISERAWRIEGWDLGQKVALCDGASAVEISGVYHDYGNPVAQWMVGEPLFRECWPDAQASGFALIGSADINWEDVRTGLSDHLQLDPDALVSQAVLRNVGLAVFDRTFQVTHALNALTLLVAGIGIFCAVSAIHHHRVGQQAQLACLGLSRRERMLLLAGQWGLLGLLCAVLVWPFGIALAGYLAGVVTPVAFGWSFPLEIQASHFLALILVAAVSLLIAVALPSLRLVRTTPAALLRAQNV